MTLLQSWPSVVDDDGTKTVGTVYNYALIAAIRASIEDNLHSPSYPNLKAWHIIEEVAAARGSKGSLTARLDVSMNADGTLKSQAGVATGTELASQIAARNVAKNGELTEWSNGASAAPDEFVLSGTGAIVAQAGSFGVGPWMAQVTRNGADCYLTEEVIAASDFDNNEDCKGQKFCAFVKCITDSAVNARLVVDDGLTQSYSSYHTGSGSLESLSVVHTISGSATKLSVYTEQKQNGVAYWGGFTYAFSDVAPNDWSPLSREPLAAQTRRGIVGTAAQTFGGHKSHTPGAAAQVASIGGLLNLQVDQKANSGTGETDAHSYSLKANTLNGTCKGLRIRAWGTIGMGNNKTIKFHFGGTSMTLYAGSTNTQTWIAEILVLREGANSQDVFGSIWMKSGIHDFNFSESFAITETADQTIKMTIQDDSASNIVYEEGFMVEVIG